MTRLAGWLVTVATILLFAGTAFCGVLLWKRRAPWHIAGTVKGTLPTHCGPHSPVVYVHDRERGTLWFPDRDRLVTLPEELRGRMRIDRFPMEGRCFVFEDPSARGEHGSRYRYWDTIANREVPIPDFSIDLWRESADGNHLFLMDLRWEHPRSFRVQGLDGSVVRELQFPVQPRPLVSPEWRELAETYRFSPGGRYLVERLPDSNPVLKFRIYDMASGRSWALGREFRDVFDDGGVLLLQPALRSDGGRRSLLWCLDFETQRERWRAEYPDDDQNVRLHRIDPSLILIAVPNRDLHVLDAVSGRRVCDLEKSANCEDGLASFRLLEGAPRPMLGSHEVWDLATGRLMPFAKPSFYPLDFFPDGRRVLISNYRGSAEIVDVETGKALFRFDDAGSRTSPIRYARRSGERVLMQVEKKWDEAEIWERRHPEGWKGHFHRPELYGALFCGAALLALWLNRPGPGRSN